VGVGRPKEVADPTCLTEVTTSNMPLRTLLCLSLLLPAACATGVAAIESAGALPDRPPDAAGVKGFPIPEMVRVPGGPFRTQGDPSKQIEPRDYTVGTFWIGKYEVTFEQFDRFCQDTGYYLKRYRGIAQPVGASTRAAIERVATGTRVPEATDAAAAATGGLQNYPVMDVCWLDAMAYCLWLTEKTGIPFRLPTQVEWEYACTVGGSEPAPANNEELDQVAWCALNMQPRVSQTQIHPVGRKRPNGAGIYDMYGNVWEWCLDGRGKMGYPQAVEEWDRVRKQLSPGDMDRGSPFLESMSSLFRGSNGNAKALRGGAWGEPSSRVSPSYRMFYPPNYVAQRVGFRVLCSENTGRKLSGAPPAAPDRARPAQTGPATADRPRESKPPAEAATRIEQRRAQLQAKITELTQAYQALLGDDFSTYPVLAWRDELQTLQERYADMLPSRERTNKMRDSLPDAQRQEYFRLRTLSAWKHFAGYTRSEKEYVLAFLTGPGGCVPLAGEARTERLAQIAAKEAAGRAEFEERYRSTALPPELVERARIDGAMEGRVNVLEAALRKVEPPEASGIGYQMQVLRYHLKKLDDPEGLARSALEEVTDQFLYEQDVTD
jgi:formylglycine-generating enzyme required for sulfatase activity